MIILKSSSGSSDTDYFLCEVTAIITLIFSLQRGSHAEMKMSSWCHE